MMRKYDFVIVGGGIIGLTIARELKNRWADSTVCILEKESDVAMHSSGRNSGVLHAGFYYTADSLKARFTRDGNRELAKYCDEHGLAINRCGKLVVAQNESELQGLEELKRRADRNGVELVWVTEEEAKAIEPNVRTYQRALYSPNTASVNPVEVCQCLKAENQTNGVEFFFNTKYLGCHENVVQTNKGEFGYGYLVNAAGLYADKIAKSLGFGKKYTIIPFKGIYLKYEKNKEDLRTNIYPVPNLSNPFLGVHFTKTVDSSIKIGPTAIPAFWRENYNGFTNFNFAEFVSILAYEARLFVTNAFNFRRLALEEIKKYSRKYFVSQSRGLAAVDESGFGHYLRPGIRAQLLNTETLELVQDFVIEGDSQSIHVLNAVSPAFTCSIPFARHVVEQIIEKQGGTIDCISSKQLYPAL